MTPVSSTVSQSVTLDKREESFIVVFLGSFVNIIYYRFFNIMKYMNVFNLSLSLSYIRVYDKKLIIHLLNVLHCNQVVSI